MEEEGNALSEGELSDNDSDDGTVQEKPTEGQEGEDDGGGRSPVSSVGSGSPRHSESGSSSSGPASPVAAPPSGGHDDPVSAAAGEDEPAGLPYSPLSSDDNEEEGGATTGNSPPPQRGASELIQGSSPVSDNESDDNPASDPQSPRSTAEDPPPVAEKQPQKHDEDLARSPSPSADSPDSPPPPAEHTGPGPRLDPEDTWNSETGEQRRRRSVSSSAGSDGEAEDEEERKGVVDDSQNSDREDEKPPRKAAILDSDSDEEHGEENTKPVDSDNDGLAVDETDTTQPKDDQMADVIADIFGDSDEEGEDFEGFGEAELEPEAEKEVNEEEGVTHRPVIEDDDDDDDEVQGDGDENERPPLPDEGSSKVEAKPGESEEDIDDGRPVDFAYDFDLMMERRKSMNKSKRRRRKYDDIINDSDDIIMAMLKQMAQVAEEDKVLNKNRQAATKKLKLLPNVLQILNKADLVSALIDCRAMKYIADWLSPLPDKSLPNLVIRTELLRVLKKFPLDQEILKSSGIGRVVMMLYKHPKETRENRAEAGRLINKWARPIFGLNTDFSTMSKDEREQRDYEHMPKKRRQTVEEGRGSRSIETALHDDESPLRPGDPGFIARARVPLPSTKDYVVRPKWNVDVEIKRGASGKKQMNRFEKHARKLKEGKKSKASAVSISINGGKMAI